MIEIKTKAQGAEPISIKLDGKELLHDGKKDWNRHAPILFPIVGQIKNGETIIENKTYKMGQHGFARDMEFEKIGTNKYLLRYNDETLEKYPYKFELIVNYIVKDNSLEVQYQVKNIDDKKIYFGLGGHPAFVCDYKNSEIIFEQEEKELLIYQLENGLIKDCPKKTEEFTDGKKIILTESFFDNDAVIMKNLKSKSIILKENGKEKLKFDFSDFPILAIWTKPNAKFLCIEPWLNTADCVNSNGIFKEKEGITILNPNEEFKVGFRVEFYK